MQQSQQAHTPWYEAFGWLDIVAQLNLLLPPLLPIFLVIEVVLLVLLQSKKQVFGIVKVPAMIHIFNRLLGLVISLDIGSWCIKLLSPYAFFQLPHTWWAFALALLVWEFSHFIFHYTSHKVRFLWCFHAPHHAPEHMSLILIYSNTLVQGMYAQLVRVSIGTLLGLDIHLLLFCMAIDFSWGGLIHVEERLWKSGKTGWRLLDTLFLMPVHHRIHHSSDAEFIDTNYCNTLPVWDRVFGTYRDVPDGTKINYGLVRPVNSTSFLDAHFGDLYLLARDMWQADNWQDRILYPFMPPGWSPRNNAASLAKT
ncbi:sterol desaturase family protein [Undibacterium sp. Di27W]|uniref:sterol desaturase family protein n=1 Tax=Undibacterium sp. Di27W TaxID=3413036 RepID=UPI003BF2406A